MRKLNKREQVLLSIFLGLLLITLVINFWLTPYLNMRDDLIIERENLQTKWEEIKGYIDKEKEIRNSIIRLEEENKKVKESIPNDQTSYKYWDMILQKARQSKVEILTIQEGELQAEGNAVTSSINIQGQLDATMNFINSLKSSSYLYAVKEGSLVEVDHGYYRTSLSLDFYFEGQVVTE